MTERRSKPRKTSHRPAARKPSRRSGKQPARAAKRGPARRPAVRPKAASRTAAAKPSPGTALLALARKIVRATQDPTGFALRDLYAEGAVSREATGEIATGLAELEEMKQGIHRVREDVEELLLFPQGTRSAGSRRAKSEIALDVFHQSGRREEFDGSSHRRFEEELVPSTHEQAAFLRQVQDARSAFSSLGERLLDVDVTAGLECGSGERLVGRGRGADVHYIDLRPRQ